KQGGFIPGVKPGAKTAEYIDAVMSRITLPGDECEKHDGGRLVRRKDDEPEAVQRRLDVYRAQTAPVLTWYTAAGAPVKTIDAVGTLEQVEARALAALGR
ncbi:MAG: hypothetical protein ACK6DK_15835, partial [Gemmatimonadota bacterium]